jgi:hypothetical protein
MARKNKEEVNQNEESQTEDTEGTGEAEDQVDPVYEAIKVAFEEAVNDGKDEDDIKMAMIGAGAKFKNVAKLYNQLMVDLGFTKSKSERNEILDRVLTGLALNEEEVFANAVALVQDEVEVEEKSAAALVRAWAKKNEVECFKPEKKVSEGPAGITKAIFDWIQENEFATEDQLVEQLKTVVTENTLRHKTLYAGILCLANRIATKYQSA